MAIILTKILLEYKFTQILNTMTKLPHLILILEKKYEEWRDPYFANIYNLPT